MAEPARPEVRYTAFLSYSHKDAAAAGRLHRRLEAYRLPKRLAGSQGARGPVPDRLWPIFRDREELPAATDLSETVREALAKSGALIILCSPDAAESLWVAEEIETFRKLHPDRPILAAILDGDPPDCFPAALRAFGQDGTWHEPLATDLRPGKDGKLLGLLKLVAGVTGVGLDALVQRDAQRRIRRVMAVTAVALVAMVIMAALAVVALQARREAERQRAEAEGLIEFMLTDLREKLRGVGSIEVMSTANRRALAYYERQESGSPGNSSAAMRARVIHAIGEDLMTRGDFPGALAQFATAHRMTTALIAEAPSDPQVIFAHGQSEYWLGRVDELRSNWNGARQRYALYAAAAERLIRIAPDNPNYMLEKAWGASNRGVVQRDGDHDPAAAQDSFEQAVRWFERALRTRPRDEDARDLANAYGDLADTFYARELWRQSLDARLRANHIYERLYRGDRADADRVYRLAISERAVARTSVLAGDRRVARPFLLKAYERAQWLTSRDPSNSEWLLFRTMVECELINRTMALDTGLPEGRLSRNIRSALATLSAQANPRVSQLAPCLVNLN